MKMQTMACMLMQLPMCPLDVRWEGDRVVAIEWPEAAAAMPEFWIVGDLLFYTYGVSYAFHVS